MRQRRSDRVIVESTVDLGRRLGLRVVAEGVEDQWTWDELARMGCDVSQGFFPTRPLPAERFIAWLTEWSPGERGLSPGSAPRDTVSPTPRAENLDAAIDADPDHADAPTVSDPVGHDVAPGVPH